MSSAVTNTSTTVASSANTTTGTTSQLQSQDFLKLLLVELEHQDPTSPMDTDKMLTQTSQLSTLEAQNATKAAMDSMTKSFQASAGYTMTSAIGKMATIGDGSINLSDGQSSKFDFYLPQAATGTTVVVKDGTGAVVSTMSLGNQPASVQTVTWDGTNAQGQRQASGNYKVTINYYDASGNPVQTTPGKLPVDSVKFTSSGDPQLKVGSSYYTMAQIQELSDY